MILTCILVIIFLGLLKSNFISSILSLGVIIWIITLVPHDIYRNNDYAAYLYVFQNPQYSTMEKGFVSLLKFFTAFHFDFDTVRILLLCFTVVILWLGAYLVSKNTWPVLVGYFFSTFFIDQVQLRNTLMWAIVFIGIVFILRSKLTLKNILVFGIIILLSTQFQSSGILYILIPIFIFRRMKIKSIETIEVKGLGIVQLFFSGLAVYYISFFILTPLLGMIQSLLPTHFVNGYLADDGLGGGKNGGIGLILYPMQTLGIIIIIHILVQELKKISRKKTELAEQSLVFEAISKFNFYLVPFIAINLNFFRILRNESIVILVLLSILYMHRDKKYVPLSMVIGTVAIILTGLWWSTMLVYPNIVVPTLSELQKYIEY
ncbi:hypothetical protein LCI01_11760 [Leuconostoc citreum]|nr:hypothetical protein LCI01_11760 [Leuconostoc citreum]